MDDDADRYIIFAGVNGAGKSTLFNSGAWRQKPGDAELPRVNPDEILVSHGWDWSDARAQLRAGKEAVRMVDALFSERTSFNQETTLSGRTIMRRIEQAAGLGYRVIMHYVGVESPHIACDRIAHRVSTGGHDIDRAVVKQRYEHSMRNLNRAIHLCDEAYLFDNTNELTLAASFYRGRLVLLSEFPRVAWLHAALDGTGLLDDPERGT